MGAKYSVDHPVYSSEGNLERIKNSEMNLQAEEIVNIFYQTLISIPAAHREKSFLIFYT
jgi:hypothetical protein